MRTSTSCVVASAQRAGTPLLIGTIHHFSLFLEYSTTLLFAMPLLHLFVLLFFFFALHPALLSSSSSTTITTTTTTGSEEEDENADPCLITHGYRDARASGG
jgi:hypothetical protein